MKYIVSVLGIRTQACRMQGADESTGLWVLVWCFIVLKALQNQLQKWSFEKKQKIISFTLIQFNFSLTFFSPQNHRVKCVFLDWSGRSSSGNQCDQIGRFLKVLATKFLAKEAQMIRTVMVYFEKSHSHVKTGLATFLGNFWKNWATFYSNIWSQWMQLMRSQKHSSFPHLVHFFSLFHFCN